MRKGKMILGITLTLCYVIGLISMVAGQVSLGLMLWVISTLGGMGFLWYTRKKEIPQDEQPGEPK